MMIRYFILVFILSSSFGEGLFAQQVSAVDICVYGATPGGVIAAYTAKKMGKSVLLIEPGMQVGGLTTGGLGYTDIGNKYAITGLSRDFYRRIGAHYGKFEQWIFEPHVAEQILLEYLRSAGITVLFHHRLVSVDKQEGSIKKILIEDADRPGKSSGQFVQAKVYIDCSYEGDLMAKAGVSYYVGREPNGLYHETYNGVQLRDKHQFPDGIDPYKIPADPASGLLWGISNASLDTAGAGDKKVQSYNFRVCLTKDPANRIDITMPEGYDSTHYALLLRYLEKKPAKDLNGFLKVDLMPNNKTDINNNGPFSTDMIGMNYDYPEAGYALREKIQRDHEQYVKGLLYFIGHDPRMPFYLRQQMLQWGYPKDEYVNNGHWSPQMYVRESRRLIGEYVMTQANCEGKEVVDDGIGLAAYTMDSHNCQRLVVNGMVKNEGDVQIGGFGPYPVSYRSIVPKPDECRNLLVPVCLSASHIAYGSIRMEPVFIVLSQSAAVAAVEAVNGKMSVQDIDIKKVQEELLRNPLADNSTPEILVDNNDATHVTKKGSWSIVTKGCYGPSMFVHDSRGVNEEGWVKFKPAIVRGGEYKVYSYFPKLDHATEQTAVTVNGKETIIKDATVRVEGQTSGEWVLLGKYNLKKGTQNEVMISTRLSDGRVVADAILFVPAFK